MGSYNTAVITTAGQALLTSILANQGTLTFSKFQTSSYQYASGTDLSALTSLNDVEQTVTPSGAGIIDSTTLYATSTVSNSGLAAEYTAYTLGLFISDGVDEVLFAVATAIVPDVIPEDIGGTPSTYTYSLQLGVSSTEDITINVDMDAYLTADSVIDNLTSTSVNSPLSANQGKLLNDNKANKADISSIITTGTKNTTGAQIASGTYFYLNGQLVKAKSDIAVNDDYTLNTNYEVVTVGGVLTELNSNKVSYITCGNVSSNTALNIDVNNSERSVIYCISGDPSRCALLFIYVGSTGTPIVAEINKGNALTVTTNTNLVTIASNNANASYVAKLIFH